AGTSKRPPIARISCGSVIKRVGIILSPYRELVTLVEIDESSQAGGVAPSSSSDEDLLGHDLGLDAVAWPGHAVTGFASGAGHSWHDAARRSSRAAHTLVGGRGPAATRQGGVGDGGRRGGRPTGRHRQPADRGR